ncbi:MAG: GlxA family transcriptional regulator, partial [Pseudomonadota bacterium]|nr:GlxA family transcriptional regulator [Pseudomonadota bacterium]
MKTPLAVSILIFPACSLMTVASAIDPMRAANRVSGQELFQWKLLSPRGLAVELTCGLSLPVNGRFSDNDKGDILLILGGFDALNQALPVTPI